MSYFYETIADIISLSQEHNISFGRVVLQAELEAYDRDETSIVESIKERLHIFEESIQAGIINTGITPSGMSGAQEAQLLKGTPRFMSPLMYKAMADAIAVNEANAKMFRIVACPTAGSCGVLPGCMKAVSEAFSLPEETMIEGFLVASGIGNVVTNRACVAGCQAKVGTAAAMATGAIIAMMGGSAEQIGHGVALCMKNLLGLVCDPVAGLVEVPCVKRNGIYAVHAIIAAELAMANIKSQIPPDEVIEAMNSIGRALPASLRETSEGGLAKTETGERIAKKVRSL